MVTRWTAVPTLLRVSNKLCTALMQHRLTNIDRFTNAEFREQFKKDLNESDDSKRKLVSIDVLSADQLFSILNLPNPKCDKNGDY